MVAIVSTIYWLFHRIYRDVRPYVHNWMSTIFVMSIKHSQWSAIIINHRILWATHHWFECCARLSKHRNGTLNFICFQQLINCAARIKCHSRWLVNCCWDNSVSQKNANQINGRVHAGQPEAQQMDASSAGQSTVYRLQSIQISLSESLIQLWFHGYEVITAIYWQWRQTTHRLDAYL